MEQEILEKITEQQEKIDAMYVSVEKLRKYFFWTFVFSVVTVVLPLLAALVIIPFALKALSTAYSGLL
ncbi:MAG TPA: hypothetical protein PKA31_01460 [Candidatus Moranbacteria bacterium]|nr:hypothetical protein [Candidatus Moranbacteria bacterium]